MNFEPKYVAAIPILHAHVQEACNKLKCILPGVRDRTIYAYNADHIGEIIDTLKPQILNSEKFKFEPLILGSVVMRNNTLICFSESKNFLELKFSIESAIIEEEIKYCKEAFNII